MATKVHQATIETIHDLEIELADLKDRNASLEVSLDMHNSELARSQEANARLAKERDYYKTFGTEIATRLSVVRECIDEAVKAANLAGYAPTATKSFQQDTAEKIDHALAKLGETFGSNGAKQAE